MLKIAHVVPPRTKGYRFSINKISENIRAHSRHDNQLFGTDEEMCICGFDIVHFHTGFDIDRALEQTERFAQRPKVVHTVHTRNKSSLRNRADRIVCISKVDRGLNMSSKTMVIENTVDVSGIERFRMKDQISVAMCSRLSALRFGPQVWSALKQINCPVFLYGYQENGGKWTDENLDFVRRCMDEKSNVHILPYDNQVEEKIISHGLFLNLQERNNHSLCFGLNVMEAASLGMPIVTEPRVQEFQIYADDRTNGFVCETKEEAVEKVNQIIKNRDLYEQICRGAEKTASRIENRMPREYDELYEELAG